VERPLPISVVFGYATWDGKDRFEPAPWQDLCTATIYARYIRPLKARDQAPQARCRKRFAVISRDGL